VATFSFSHRCSVVCCYETRDDIVFVAKLDGSALCSIYFAQTYMP